MKPHVANDFSIKFAAKPRSSYAEETVIEVSSLVSAGNDKAKRLQHVR